MCIGEQEYRVHTVQKVVNMMDGESPLQGEIRGTWALVVYIAPVSSSFNSYLLAFLNCQQLPASLAFPWKMQWKC